jgi:hypothetical protein
VFNSNPQLNPPRNEIVEVNEKITEDEFNQMGDLLSATTESFLPHNSAMDINHSEIANFVELADEIDEDLNDFVSLEKLRQLSCETCEKSFTRTLRYMQRHVH